MRVNLKHLNKAKKKKVCLRFADRPCFIAANPTIFYPKIKKKRDCCPTLLERS